MNQVRSLLFFSAPIRQLRTQSGRDKAFRPDGVGQGLNLPTF